ncbi:glycosyltransferase family 4 protein [Pelagicoccus mobilis]|uniref:Glycosyltransferase n=1 Tax=Pelagicoccus mobilis TaxID=415221 RepID=A0A934RXN1_9BACT|nr:glycosyltransferase [Pelagicoccus mobilis]MBK1878218.1 glycosyltransferase [Pelagicoccus mobilis]
MKFIFINPDGDTPNGVLSLGAFIHDNCPESYFLSLNGPSSRFAKDRQTSLPLADSHNPDKVASKILEIVAQEENETFAVIPNAGIIPNLGALKSMEDASRGNRIRILGTIHRDSPNAYNDLVPNEERFSAFFAVSEKATTELRDRLPHRSKEIFELPLPNPYQGPKSSANPTEPLRLAYTGRLEEPDKRVSRLLEVAQNLTERSVPFRLQIIGEGRERPRLEASAERLGLAPFIVFRGSLDREALFEELTNNDIILLCSAFEGTPVSIIEGMAAGNCPVVMDIESGIRSLIENNKSGFIVPQGDTDQMAAAIHDLHLDRSRLQAIKNEATAQIERKHSPERFIRTLGIILDQVSHSQAPKLTKPLSLPPMQASIQSILQIAERSAKTAIFGGGFFGRSLADSCLDSKIQIFCIVDSDTSKSGQKYMGIPIQAPQDLESLLPEQILIGSADFANDIISQIKELYRSFDTPLPKIVAAGNDEMPFDRTEF